MAATFPDAVRSFTVVIDDIVSISNSGINSSSATMRHLFSGGTGQRYTANLICRTDTFKNADLTAVLEAGLADRLTGRLCTIGATEYRIMAANTTADGGLLRLALDSTDQVGL